MKICLVCAPGGHLIEMMKFNDALSLHDTFLITYKGEFIILPKNIKNIYYIKNILVNSVQANVFIKTFLILLQMLILTVKQLEIILIENPKVIISTGSEIAIPICYISKILGKKVIFIESLCRVSDLSGTGKIVKPISDIFLVQWENLSKKYKNVIYKGNILSSCFEPAKCKKLNKSSFIFVTIGTAPFPRLVEMMDEISKTLNEKVIIQIGKTNYKPKNAEYFDFADYEMIRELNKNARIVISHSGVGSIMTALEANAPLVVVPRLRENREVIDDHQLEIINILKEQKLAEIAYEINDISQLLKSINCKNLQKNQDIKNQNNLNMFIQKVLSSNLETIKESNI